MYKILFVSGYSSYDISGTSNTMRNLFDCIPEANVMWLHIGFENISECESGQTTIDIDSSFAKINYLIWKYRWQNNPTRYINVSNTEDAETNISIKEKARQFIKGLLDSEAIRFSKDTMKTIEEFSPEIIYTIGGNIMVLKAAYWLSCKLGCSVIMHFMDNWIDTIYTQSKSLKIFRKKVLRYCELLNSKSKVNFAISEPLAKKMETLYSKKYLPLMNPVEIDNYKTSSINQKDKMLFVYGGSLSLNRWENLVEIFQAIKKVTSNFTFTIYAPEKQISQPLLSAARQCGIVLLKYIPYTEIQKVYQNADVLVLASPSGGNYELFAKYSLSTKVPEYMSIGKPILVYSKEHQHVADYIQRNNAGLVARDNDELIENVRLLINPEIRNTLAKNGLKCVMENHSKKSAHDKLVYALNETRTKDDVN